jgi:hypothetical protein
LQYEKVKEMCKYDGTHIMDLTVPREEILKTLTSVVRKRGKHTCAVCQELLRDAQMDADGNPAFIPERGIARRLPCNHVFHIECLVQTFITDLVCPYCRSGYEQVYIFNGSEPTVYRHDVDDVPFINGGFVPEGGLNRDFTGRSIYGRLSLRPFSSTSSDPQDRWGDNNDLVEIAQEDATRLRVHQDSLAVQANLRGEDYAPTELQGTMNLLADSIGAYEDAYEVLKAKQQEDSDNTDNLETAQKGLQAARSLRNSLMNQLRWQFDVSEQQNEFRAQVNRYIRRVNVHIASDEVGPAESAPMLIPEF